MRNISVSIWRSVSDVMLDYFGVFVVCALPSKMLAFAAKLGANAILGVSLAVCKAGAAQKVKYFFLTALSLTLFYEVEFAGKTTSCLAG